MAVVTLPQLIKDLHLEIVYLGDPENSGNIGIHTSDINRPGLQFANYFVDFDDGTATRLQVIGHLEMTYLRNLNEKTLKTRLKKYFSYPLPCVVLCRNLTPTAEMIEAAQKNKKTILRTELITTEFISVAVNYLDNILAPQMEQHGVLVNVYGLGVLLLGESGIGKSETALELIKRGHRLISDDVVNIKKVARNRLIGEAPQNIRHFMEIRGIGIINVREMYGVGAIMNATSIDLVVQLEPWEKGSYCERLGLDEQFINILGVNVHQITIPIKPGRNLAIIVEAAARDSRLKKMGYNAAEELTNQLRNEVN